MTALGINRSNEHLTHMALGQARRHDRLHLSRLRMARWSWPLAVVVAALYASAAAPTVAAGAAPANDAFPGQTIVGTGDTVLGSNVGATGQLKEPEPEPNPYQSRSVWFSWTAPQDGMTTLSLRGASFDTTLGVFTGTAVASLKFAGFAEDGYAWNDDFNGTPQSFVYFYAVKGVTYRIMVNGKFATSGPFSLQWANGWRSLNDFYSSPQYLGSAPAGSHDAHCDDWGLHCTQATNQRTSAEPGEPSHDGVTPRRTTWYSLTAAESGTAVVNTVGSTFDTVLAAYTGGPQITKLQALASNDDYISPLTRQSRIAFPVVKGWKYTIALDGYRGEMGDIHLQWAINPPANDDFAAAQTITGLYGTTAASTVQATGEPGEADSHGDTPSDTSVWFRWTPATSGPAVVRALNTACDCYPGIAIYKGASLGGLTPVAASKLAGVVNYRPFATFQAVAGTEYRIAVTTGGPPGGAFTLEYGRATCEGIPATIIGSGGPITATSGNDVIFGSASGERIDGGGGNDTICGLGGNDLIAGGPGKDREYGGLGDDTFTEGATANGADIIDGEAGNDTASYDERSDALSVSLDANPNDGSGGGGELDNVTTTIENVRGGEGSDALTGDILDNVLSGAGGNDTIHGAGGNDTLSGGVGTDTLFGEAGMDALDVLDGDLSDTADGGAGVDTVTKDSGDTILNVP
jgi:Ca2+-binding RTX toxin-like protein